LIQGSIEQGIALVGIGVFAIFPGESNAVGRFIARIEAPSRVDMIGLRGVREIMVTGVRVLMLHLLSIENYHP